MTPQSPNTLIAVVQQDGRHPSELPAIHPAGTPLVVGDDLGVVRGDGCFETLLVAGGEPRKVERHLRRLANSQAMLGIEGPSPAQWEAAIAFAAGEWAMRRTASGESGPDEAMLRLVLTRGPEQGGDPTAYITMAPVPEVTRRQRADGVRLMTQERGFSIDLAAGAPWQLLGAKTLSYATNMASLRAAQDNGFDDVLYVSSEGLCLEGPRSTLVVARGGELVSPPNEIGILAGTTLDALTVVAEKRGIEVRRENLRPAELAEADGVWMVSSVAKCLRVTAVDDAEIAQDSGIDMPALVDEALGIG